MRVYLMDASSATDEQLKKLFATLPPFRIAAANRCRRPEAYRASILGFCLVRYAVKALSSNANTEHWAYNGCGKPHLLGDAPCFNLSHAGDVIAVAVADSEIGLDVEKITPHAKGFASHYLSEHEKNIMMAANDPGSEMTRLWSAKEARLKYEGNGIRYVNLRDIPSNGVKNVFFSLRDASYWLSLCPACEELELTWVDPADLH